MEAFANKRESYSFFTFESVLHRCWYKLDSAPMVTALELLETTPGVKGWKFVLEEATFVHDGKQRVTKLPLAGVGKNGERFLVQLLRGSESKAEAAELDAGRAYAVSKQCAHWPVRGRDVMQNRIELLNRQCAHAFLRHATNWDTCNLERRVLQMLGDGPLLLSELTRLLGLTPTQCRVVVLRAWLRDTVKWDIAHIPVNSDWKVCHA